MLRYAKQTVHDLLGEVFLEVVVPLLGQKGQHAQRMELRDLRLLGRLDHLLDHVHYRQDVFPGVRSGRASLKAYLSSWEMKPERVSTVVSISWSGFSQALRMSLFIDSLIDFWEGFKARFLALKKENIIAWILRRG